MDSNNLDRILALAAGILPEEEARVAEAALTAEDRAELEAQRAVLAAIADAPPVGMTDIERAHLHRSVAAAIAETTLELAPAAVAASAAASRRRRSGTWLRWASGVAVAATFIGVVAVASQLDRFGAADDSADALISAETDATSTTAASALSGPPTTVVAGPESDAGGGMLTEDRLASGEALLLPEGPELSGAEDSDLAVVSTFLQDLGRPTLGPIDDVSTLPCYEVAVEDDDLEIADGFTVTYPGPGGELLAGIGYADAGTDTAEPIIRIYDLATCEPVLVSTD